MLELFSLADKVAVVTGGAGRHTPVLLKALAEAGAVVYGADLDEEQMRVIAAELSSDGLRVEGIGLNLAHEDTILALRDYVLGRSGKVDILVNAAVGRFMSGWRDEAQLFRESMEVNATGLYLVTRIFGDVMAEQGGGSIINIASIQGMVGPDPTLYEGLDFHGLIPDYFFHKAGMINFTRFVAAYYGPRNVRCNCISPGGICADDTPAEFERRYRERTLLGRMATPHDLAGTIVFLASGASGYLTGVNIPIDGGYTSK